MKEHQLLKDRKKTQKKRPLSGENMSSSSSAVSLLTKTEGNDIHAVRLVVVDGQNIQKVGSGKASPLKRSGNMNISCNKSDLSPVKISKQRRRTGSISSAAYKRWEKAAIAGVSLVADAAEQLERKTADRDVNANHGTSNVDDNEPLPPDCHSFLSPISDRVFSQNPIAQNFSQASMKLKLQLFPIDEVTRRALEKDELNPHLELTLSSRKKIASVLEHLSHKWGNSSIALGELVLFPYSLQQQSITADCQRWTFKDTTSSAADVYEAIGKPPVFRLRYGWFSDTELKPSSYGVSSTSIHLDDCLPSNGIQGQEFANAADGNTVAANVAVRPKSINQPSFPDSHDQRIHDILECDSPVGSGHVHTASFLKEDDKGGDARKHLDDLDKMRLSNGATLTAGEWADSLTNISIGELLSEASRGMDVSCIDPPVARSDSILHQIPFSSDSFDAAIAAHLSGPRATPALCTQIPHASIWDAEETCDAFSFRKVSSINQEVTSPSPSTSFRACHEIFHSNSLGFHGLIEELAQIEEPEKPDKEEDMKGSHSDAQSEDDSAKNLSLTDLYWNRLQVDLDVGDICVGITLVEAGPADSLVKSFGGIGARQQSGCVMLAIYRGGIAQKTMFYLLVPGRFSPHDFCEEES
ncbi:TSL-kinase interacting protein [Asimina triloba]